MGGVLSSWQGLVTRHERSMPGAPPAQLTLAGTLRGKRWRRQEVRACSVEHQQLRAASWATVPLPSFSSSVLLQAPPPILPVLPSAPVHQPDLVLSSPLDFVSSASPPAVSLPTSLQLRCPRISLLPPRPMLSPALGPQTSWVLSPVSHDVAGAQPRGSGTSGCCLKIGRTSSKLLLSPHPHPTLQRERGR